MKSGELTADSQNEPPGSPLSALCSPLFQISRPNCRRGGTIVLASRDTSLQAMDTTQTSDRDLLARFAVGRDEAAFAELVRRHCRMVLGLCRRVLGHAQDAEDAFQATFLVLASRAGRIRKKAALASWLYGVAHRTSLRALAHRQRRREVPLEEATPMTSAAAAPLDEVTARHELETLDEELCALPKRYRDPLVLRYVQGRTYEEIAEELGLTVTAVEGRLKRGKGELRMRLARRGIGLTSALAALSLATSSASAAIVEISLPPLVAVTTQAALSFVRNPPPGGTISPAVRLATQELATMSIPTAYIASALAVLVVVASLAGQGAGGVARSQDAAPASLAAFTGNAADEDGQADAVEVAPPPKSAAVQKKAPKASPKMKEAPPVKESPPAGAGDDWTIHVRVQSSGVKKIRAELEKPTTFEFNETPLKDVVDFLKGLHKINIEFDRKALDDVQINPDETLIKRQLKDISLRSALRSVLEQLNLDYVIANEVLLITTKEQADARVDTRVYNAGRLKHLKSGLLIKVITTTTFPDSWDHAGGPGTIMELPNGSLVVSQTQRVHEDIVDLLNALEVDARKSAEDIDRGRVGESPDGAPAVVTALANIVEGGAKAAKKGAEAAPQPKSSPPTEPAKTKSKAANTRRTDATSQYEAVHFMVESLAAKKIRAELDKPTTFEFSDTPLKDVILFLSDLHKMNIQFDAKALKDAGIDPDKELITRQLKDVSLHAALRLIFEQLNLDYVTANEVLLITTEEKADARLDTRVYDIRRLKHLEADALMKVIQSTIRPESWKVEGGPGGPGTIGTLPGGLVIRQSQRVHEEIVDLFHALYMHAPAPAEAAPAKR
jgi:RNA polymerase sigma factor (sigma-70 family)